VDGCRHKPLWGHLTRCLPLPDATDPGARAAKELIRQRATHVAGADESFEPIPAVSWGEPDPTISDDEAVERYPPERHIARVAPARAGDLTSTPVGRSYAGGISE
jgi:hypothetical protein